VARRQLPPPAAPWDQSPGWTSRA